MEVLAREWLTEINSKRNRWDCLRNAGLCGKDAPRGIIFSMIMDTLFDHSRLSPEQDALDMVTKFRSKFSKDPGLDGCLLELEEILKLRFGYSIGAFLLQLDPNTQEWTVGESIDLPPSKTPVNVMMYDELHSTIERTSYSKISTSSS